MTEESFLLLNLKDDKAKKLAQVISNDSCRKILEFLTHNDKATESELSVKLEIPMSTVHYNLQHLQKSKLIKVDEFHYSKKGKEINHYKLAKKFIIIAPDESTPGLMEKLKNILPLGLFALIAAAGIQTYNFITNSIGGSSLTMMSKSTDYAVNEMAYATQDAVPRTISQTTTSEPNIALWFLAGSMFMMLVVLLISLIKRK